MRTNLYYRTILCRYAGPSKAIKLWTFYFISPGRMLLEVFIRKNFGERYFRPLLAFVVILTLGFWPVLMVKLDFIPSLFSSTEFGETATGSPYIPYIAWYVFLLGFAVMCGKHWLSIEYSRSSFDFTKYSLYNGDRTPLFFKLKIFGKEPNLRQVECWLEPMPFFLAGLLFTIIGQNLGHLLILCSLSYALSYAIEYKAGDDFILDQIDEMLVNDDMMQSFVNGGSGDSKTNFQFKARSPQDHERRAKLLSKMIVDDDAAEVR